MARIERFEDLPVWQTARALARRIYEMTGEPAWARDWGLRDQIRRSAVSVMSNIAEGFESDSTVQFLRFLGYAKGSAGETRAQLYVALDAGYVDRECFGSALELVQSCSRQLHGLMAYLRSDQHRHLISERPTPYGTADLWDGICLDSDSCP